MRVPNAVDLRHRALILLVRDGDPRTGSSLGRGWEVVLAGGEQERRCERQDERCEAWHGALGCYGGVGPILEMRTRR